MVLTYRTQCLINNFWVLEIVVREDVELIQKIADVNATERIHLREW